jgi:thioesterase domain-containing protein
MLNQHYIRAMSTAHARTLLAALVAVFRQSPIALIGASFGSMLAHNLAHSARAAGANPQRVILIDPFPIMQISLSPMRAREALARPS